MSDLDPVPPDAFDVERPKPQEPTHYRDAVSPPPDRYGEVRGPIPRRSRPTSRVVLFAIVFVVLGALLAMCGRERRRMDAERTHSAQ
jgi:hypothetical protein